MMLDRDPNLALEGDRNPPPGAPPEGPPPTVSPGLPPDTTPPVAVGPVGPAPGPGQPWRPPMPMPGPPAAPPPQMMARAGMPASAMAPFRSADFLSNRFMSGGVDVGPGARFGAGAPMGGSAGPGTFSNQQEDPNETIRRLLASMGNRGGR